jgi:hypothetical protein
VPPQPFGPGLFSPHAAGERVLEKATPEAQGLVAWWLDKENVLPDEFSIFNPRAGAIFDSGKEPKEERIRCDT